MERIYICAPITDDTGQAELAVRKLCRKAVAQGDTPFAPTLLFAGMLKHQSGPMRHKGERCSLQWLGCCHQLWVASDQGIRPRMKTEIELAKSLGLKIVYFSNKAIA